MESPREPVEQIAVEEAEGSGSRGQKLSDMTNLTLIRYFQDLPDADIPPNPVQPRYHTGRLPNSKAGDGKPRLLLMGQRRRVRLLV